MKATRIAGGRPKGQNPGTPWQTHTALTAPVYLRSSDTTPYTRGSKALTPLPPVYSLSVAEGERNQPLQSVTEMVASQEALVSVKEAMGRHGLDFTVSVEPLFMGWGKCIDQGRAVVLRKGEREPQVVGVVGPKWQPYQPIEQLEWLDTFTKETNSHIVSMGRHGASTFARVELRGRQEIGGSDIAVGDIIGQELWITDSLDGSASQRFVVRHKRIVCSNGMTTLSDHLSISNRHVGDTTRKLQDAIDLMRRVDLRIESEVEEMSTWAQRPISTWDSQVAMIKILRNTSWTDAAVHYTRMQAGKARAPRGINQLRSAFVAAPGQSCTVWGLVNAFTYVGTHQSSSPISWDSSNGRSKESRVLSAARELTDYSVQELIEMEA